MSSLSADPATARQAAAGCSHARDEFLADGRRAWAAGVRVERSLAAVRRLSAEVAVLGHHADRDLRCLRAGPDRDSAGGGGAVRLCGQAAGDRGSARGRDRGGVAVPSRHRCRVALRGSSSTRVRGRGGHQRAERGTDRPAATGQHPRTGREQLHPWVWIGTWALVTSALVQYAPAPTHLVWWLLLGGFALAIPGVLAVPESVVRHPGALRSLRPRLGVPRPCLGAFVAGLPGMVALWALGGFYLSLGPSLAGSITGSRNLLWGGVMIVLLTGVGSLSSLLFRNSAPAAAVLWGAVALLAGVGVTWAGSRRRRPSCSSSALRSPVSGSASRFWAPSASSPRWPPRRSGLAWWPPSTSCATCRSACRRSPPGWP